MKMYLSGLNLICNEANNCVYTSIEMYATYAIRTHTHTHIYIYIYTAICHTN